MLPPQQSDIVVIIWYLDRCWDFTEWSTIFSCWHCSLFSQDGSAPVHSAVMTLGLSVCPHSLQTGAWTTADMDAERQTLPSPCSKVISDDKTNDPVIKMLGFVPDVLNKESWVTVIETRAPVWLLSSVMFVVLLKRTGCPLLTWFSATDVLMHQGTPNVNHNDKDIQAIKKQNAVFWSS